MRPLRQPEDRRHEDRRSEDVRLADFTIPRLRKAILTALLLAGVLGLLLYMLGNVLVAIIAGVVVGAYLLPVHNWLKERLSRERSAAIITITAFAVPLIAALSYSWVELSSAAVYLEVNREAVAARLTTALHSVPFTEGLQIQDDLSNWVGAAANRTTAIVEDFQEALYLLVISIGVFLVTVFYILTDHATVAEYLRSKLPGRYMELADRVSGGIRAVVYGALYATFLVQLLKAGVVLALNLIWDVPLAIVLSIAAFFIGFFPVVGSWVIYVPTGIYLMVFRNEPVGGALLIVIGLVVNTITLSLYLRPKIASEQAHILNFYWMFIALITGVYTFGLIGIIIGPVLVALLKTVFDTLTENVVPARAIE